MIKDSVYIYSSIMPIQAPILCSFSSNNDINSSSSRLNSNFELVNASCIYNSGFSSSNQEVQFSSKNVNNGNNSECVQFMQIMDSNLNQDQPPNSQLLARENENLKKQLEWMKIGLTKKDQEKERLEQELNQNRSVMARILACQINRKRKEREAAAIKYRWRDQKYDDEKAGRRLEIEQLKKEIECRQKARHNRGIEDEENRRMRLGIEGLRLERYLPLREEFPELPLQAKMLISCIWNRNESETEVFVNGFGADITRKDLLTLSGTEWLNDEVINFFLNLIVERNSSEPNLPNVYTFNTFFYKRLREVGFSGVKRWTKKVNIFDYQVLLVPIHLGNHWCMAIIDFDQHRIEYYDSLFGENSQCLDLLRKYLAEESIDKRKQQFETNDWTLICRKDIPHQMNMCDCGMFACLFAEYVSRRAPITFNQEHIQYFRMRMAWEICQKKLLGG